MTRDSLIKRLSLKRPCQNSSKLAARVGLIGLTLSSLLSGCALFEEPSASEAPVSAERAALLSNLAREVYRPAYLEVMSALERLEVEAEGWTGALEGEALEGMRASWRALMLAWQRAELMQVGPAGVSSSRLGGEDRRDLIYAYPLHYDCRVDQELASGRFREATWGLSATINARGLDALERVLFYEGSDNACPEASALNREGQWSALVSDAEGFQQARADFARALIADLHTQLSALTNAWGSTEAEQGPLTLALSEGSAPFSSQREALDEVYASLFYVDLIMKDVKLALPLGLSADCEAERCPERLEHLASGLSREALIANLEGLLRVWLGGEPSERAERVGFDDVLSAEGAAELGEQVTSRIEALIGELSGREERFERLVSEDPAWLELRHAELRELMDLLKSQLPVVLNLSVPMEGAGDND